MLYMDRFEQWSVLCIYALSIFVQQLQYVELYSTAGMLVITLQWQYDQFHIF